MADCDKPTPGPSTRTSKDLEKVSPTGSMLCSPVSTSQPSTRPPSVVPNQRGRGKGRCQWLKQLSPSLELENSGSVARDHLAAERTFLAYIRTSLGCAAAGVALVQLLSMSSAPPRKLKLLGQVIGALIELLGLGILVLAVQRYFSTQRTLIAGMYKPAGKTVAGIAISVACIVFLVFGLMLGIAFS